MSIVYEPRGSRQRFRRDFSTQRVIVIQRWKSTDRRNDAEYSTFWLFICLFASLSFPTARLILIRWIRKVIFVDEK